MVQPLAALLSLALLPVAAPVAAPDAAAAPGAFSSAAPIGAGTLLAAPAAATPPPAVLDDETPTGENDWLLQSAGASAPLVVDLRRPRLLAAAVPETPHPTAVRRRDADAACPLPALHLVRLTKDRGS